MDETRSRTLARDNTTLEAQEAIPLAEEELVVDRRKVERGRVRVTKTVREHEALVQDSILREEVEMQRVAIDRVVQQAPEVRYEADVLVIPIVQTVRDSVRKTDVEVENVGAGSAAPAAARPYSGKERRRSTSAYAGPERRAALVR